MNKIDSLKPKVRKLAYELISECEKEGIEIKIVQTLRSIRKQNDLYAQGRTKPGNIVTNAKGGYSFHNFGVAFDVCPVVNKKLEWNDKKLFKKIGAIGISLGLEWGGAWKTFKDLPHFQYRANYTLNDFRTEKVNYRDFD